MQVYAPPGPGLGSQEVSAFQRLSPRSRALVADEFRSPESHEAIRWVLQQRDPEAALADAISENVHQASRDAASGVGLGDGLGRSFFKRLTRFHRKIFNVFKKVDPGLHALTKKKHSGSAAVPYAAATASAPAPMPPPVDSGSSAAPGMYNMPAPIVPTPPASQPSPSSSMYNMPSPQVPVNYVQEQPPTDPSASAPPTFDPSTMTQVAAPATPVAPVPAAASPSTPVAASSYTTGTDETAGLPSATGYTLTVEGQTITNYPVDITQISSLVQSGTQPGDRFEILADGVGTGLRVRTTTGFISIPDSMRAQVQAMPKGQVLALLTQAAANVAASGVPMPTPLPATPPPSAAPASDGGGIVWLLGAGGVVAALAVAGGGKRR